MFQKTSTWLPALCLLLSGLFCPLPAIAAAEQARVLFISSYHPGFPTFFQQVQGLSEVFRRENVLCDIEFMDTKQYPTRQNIENFRQSLAYKLSLGQGYDAIITGDDAALQFAVAEQTRLFQHIPIVFLGLNNHDLALAQNDNPYITGISETVSMRETLELMASLHPQVQLSHLTLAGLPPASIILNRPPSFLQKYRQGLLVVVSLLILGAGLILLLLSQLRQQLQSQEALRKSEESFRNIVHFSPMGVLLFRLEADNRLVLTGTNPAAKAIFHTDLDGLTGKTLEEVFPKWQGTIVAEQFRKVCTLGVPWFCRQIDYDAPPITGSFEIHAFQTDQRKMACFFQDISERTQAEQTLKNALNNARNARQQLETILKSVSDGLLFTDLDHRIMLMSHSAEELLGQALGEVYGLEVGSVIRNDKLMNGLRAIAAGEQEEDCVEMALPTPDADACRTVQAKLAAVRNMGGLKRGIITLLRDISCERELDLMKTEFISTAAHELRTPLTSVIGFSELLLKQGGFDEQQAEFLKIIHKKAEVLGKIVEDLLDLARVDSGQVIRLNKDRADICSILSRSVADYQRVCKDRRFKAVLPEEPICMVVDDRKLFQVMENLLSNAVKFSPADSLIQVTCQPAETEVFIAVNDEGIGMNQAQIRHIFDKFYRVDASNTAREGLGLGMAIVKSIVEAHQGRIWVTSKPERGTTVTFTLPRTEK